jgi:hypothetical protein
MRNIAIRIIVISIVLIFAPMFSLVNASTVGNLLIESGQQETLTINLQAKQIVTGSFNVTGLGSALAPNAIDFWVIDPNGAMILNSGTVLDGENFTFTASSEGEYILNFQNNAGYRMYVVYEYSEGSTPIPEFDPLVFSGWVIIIVAVSAIIGFVVYGTYAKRRATVKTSQGS